MHQIRSDQISHSVVSDSLRPHESQLSVHGSRFLCNIALYSIGPCFCHQSHSQLGVVFALAPSLHSFWTPHFKSINSSVLSFLPSPTLTSIHDYWENLVLALTRRTFVGKVMSLLFNMLSRLVTCMQVRKQQSELDTEQQTGSK